MKKTFIIAAALLSFPMFDYTVSSVGLSISDSAEAYVARRTAFAARGPYGGAVVGTRRTAFGRPGYYFMNSQVNDRTFFAAEVSDSGDPGPEQTIEPKKADEQP